MLVPTVEFCGIQLSRLLIGGNPFSGFSHQSPVRDEAMMDYYSVERIKETLRRAEAAGINATILRSDRHVHRLLREFRNEGGRLHWIAQIGAEGGQAVPAAIDAAVAQGARAAFIHGGFIDQAYADKDADSVAAWLQRIRSHGIPAGVAGHAHEGHLWIASLGLADFHAVCFYNCGSLHQGKGERFDPADPPKAIDAIQAISKPCIGYKIMGAGRVPPVQAFEYAFAGIKPGDVVNVGMYRGDKDDMVEENAATVGRILAARA